MDTLFLLCIQDYIYKTAIMKFPSTNQTMELLKNVKINNFVKYFLGGSVITYTLVKVFKYIKILGPSAGLSEDLTGKTIIITGNVNLVKIR
jgi:hypothetical protein